MGALGGQLAVRDPRPGRSRRPVASAGRPGRSAPGLEVAEDGPGGGAQHLGDLRRVHPLGLEFPRPRRLDLPRARRTALVRGFPRTENKRLMVRTVPAKMSAWGRSNSDRDISRHDSMSTCRATRPTPRPRRPRRGRTSGGTTRTGGGWACSGCWAWSAESAGTTARAPPDRRGGRPADVTGRSSRSRAALGCLRLAIPLQRSRPASVGSECTSREPRELVTRCTGPGFVGGDDGAPQVPGGPVRACRVLRPRRDRRARP